MISESVRQLALQPFRELPLPPSVTRVAAEGVLINIDTTPGPPLVSFTGEVGDLDAAIAFARATTREHGKDRVIWWVAPEHQHLEAELAAHGLVNEDPPGFEATENALALVEAPIGDRPDGVDVRLCESWDDFIAASRLGVSIFGMTPTPEERQRKLYEDYVLPTNPGRQFIASIDGRIVGKGYGALGQAGINLFGGAVLEEARGQGVYRALLFARWDFAVARGTPALTVQAGRMSRPICERLGFQFVGAAHVFVDDLSR